MTDPSWQEMGFGSYPVTEISHSILTLHDGTDIAIKVWLPCSKYTISNLFPFFATEENTKWMTEMYSGSEMVKSNPETSFPAIIEYLPYAKDSDLTLSRDYARHPWFCSHGFVDFRIDLRGSGASSGFYYDEYDEQEMEDCIEIIEWIASQAWSNQRVGMYGKSWGGFNGLQLAYKQPEALRAVISLYSTDNRFSDDIHYQGNTVIGNGMLSWASFMFAIDARPPPPRYFDTLQSWKDFWLSRLENSSQSCLSTWLYHQHRLDPYWQHGSIDQNISNIKCPVLIFGGHADGYKNAALRMAAMLNDSSRAIIGPWAHQWPDVSVAGPNIDYLNLCLKWWTMHLKQIKPDFPDLFSWPRLQLFIRDSVKPEEVCSSAQGKWVCLPDWNNMYNKFVFNSHSNVDHNVMQMYFGTDMSLQFHGPESPDDHCIQLVPDALQGSGAGMWLIIDNGASGDQTTANKHSTCWITNVLESDVVFAGLGKVDICVTAERAGRYGLQVRVCDQFPTGESTLITKGCQNLSRTKGGWVCPFPAKEKRTVTVNLNGIGQTIRAGHRILVSITPTYFPEMYPAVSCEGLSIYPHECVMVFQTLTANQLSNTAAFPTPKPLLKLPVETLTVGDFFLNETVSEDGSFVVEVKDRSGRMLFPTMGYEFEMNTDEKYTTDKKVSSAVIVCKQSILSAFDVKEVKVNTLVETYQKMTDDKQCFRTEETLTVQVDGKLFFNETWKNVIPRKYV